MKPKIKYAVNVLGKKINDEEYFLRRTVQPNESTISSLVVK